MMNFSGSASQTCFLSSFTSSCQSRQHAAGATGPVGWRTRHSAPGTSSDSPATWSASTVHPRRLTPAPTPCGSSETAAALCAAPSPGSWSSTPSSWWCLSCCCRPKASCTAFLTGSFSTGWRSSPSPHTQRPCAQTRLVSWLSICHPSCLCILFFLLLLTSPVSPTGSRAQGECHERIHWEPAAETRTGGVQVPEVLQHQTWPSSPLQVELAMLTRPLSGD